MYSSIADSIKRSPRTRTETVTKIDRTGNETALSSPLKKIIVREQKKAISENQKKGRVQKRKLDQEVSANEESKTKAIIKKKYEWKDLERKACLPKKRKRKRSSKPSDKKSKKQKAEPRSKSKKEEENATFTELKHIEENEENELAPRTVESTVPDVTSEEKKLDPRTRAKAKKRVKIALRKPGNDKENESLTETIQSTLLEAADEGQNQTKDSQVLTESSESAKVSIKPAELLDNSNFSLDPTNEKNQRNEKMKLFMENVVETNSIQTGKVSRAVISFLVGLSSWLLDMITRGPIKSMNYNRS